jgi:hypothetical protein
MKICPEHKKSLLVTKTKYGNRYKCSECEVYCWSGQTSTPALPKVHEARKYAHAEFDELWTTKRERGRTYKALSEYMNMPIQKTHIGMFDDKQCLKVLNFVQVQKGKNHDA